MNTLKNSFLLFITLFFFSCNSFVHKNKESYELRATDEYLKFPLNSKTSLLIKAITAVRRNILKTAIIN
jgi:hypothetical protein